MVSASEELSKAQESLKNATRNFNEVDPEFVETAIYEVLAAESRFSALLRQARRDKECLDKV